MDCSREYTGWVVHLVGENYLFTTNENFRCTILKHNFFGNVNKRLSVTRWATLQVLRLKMSRSFYARFQP